MSAARNALRSPLPTLLLLLFGAGAASAGAQQTTPPDRDLRIRGIVEAVSADRIEADIRTLVGFGTRHTLSDTLSETHGIGAARRWIHAELERISDACDGCLDVEYQRYLVAGDTASRIPEDTWVVSVTATLRGTRYPDRYVIMSGDIDSRVSDVMDFESESPGANDNASGLAGTLEAARVLTQQLHRSGERGFDKTVVFAALAGEEQGLYGGEHLAAKAVEEGWQVEAVLNNDMIGNIAGIDGVVQSAPAPRFSRTPGSLQGAGSKPGADSDAVLQDWGFSSDEIAGLKKGGAIGG